jgi:nucleotide-binding universal stress UspA family protein
MTVVAGVDGSPISLDVARSAMAEARCRGTDLHLVHVTNFPLTYSEVAIVWGEVMDAERRSAWAQLEGVIGDAGTGVERVDLEGYPADALVDYADEVGADLLVVGTRGRGEFASLILGSTSQRAIHVATCDVLVVKPSEQLAQSVSELSEPS